MTNFRAMKTEEFKDAVYYRVACSCGSDEHDVTLELEKDSVFEDLTLTFYKKIYYTSHWKPNFFSRLWIRIKGVIKLLFTGYIELESDFILQGEEHIDSFIKALEEGKHLIKK